MNRYLKGFGSILAVALFVFGNSSAQESKMIITANDGAPKTCTLLFADSSSLVVWKGNEPYASEKAKVDALRLYPNEINRIVIVREGHFWSGAGTGFLVGAGAGAIIGFASGDDQSGFIRLTAGGKAMLLGISGGLLGSIVGGVVGAAQGADDDFVLNGRLNRYLEVLPKLRQEAVFRSKLPPELRDSLSEDKDMFVRSPEESAGKENELPEPSAARFHFSVSGALSLVGPASDNITSAFNASGFGGTIGGFFGPTDYPTSNGTPFSWGISGEYSVSDQWRAGLSWSSFPTSDIHGSDEENESTRGSSFGIVCSYVPFPVNKLLTSRSEFAFFGGVTYSLLYVDGTISSLYGSAISQAPVSFHENEKAVGFQLGASYDYYFSRSVSFQCRASENYIPSSVSVHDATYTNPYDGSTKTLTAHTVNFSRLEISIGLRVHI